MQRTTRLADQIWPRYVVVPVVNTTLPLGRRRTSRESSPLRPGPLAASESFIFGNGNAESLGRAINADSAISGSWLAPRSAGFRYQSDYCS